LRTPENAKMRSQVARFVGKHLAYATPETVCAWIDRGAGESANRFWTLDPIDGTKGFLRADQYAVALALIIGGKVEGGVLGCPNHSGACTPDHGGPGSLVVAVRGQGTWTQPLAGDEWTRLKVSDRAKPSDARILRSVEAAHTNVSEVDLIAERLGVRVPAVKMDSQAKYAVMAAGAGDLLFRLLSPKRMDYKEKIWDQAAGSLVVEEAGGRITDLHGKPLDFTQGRTLANNTGVLASNTLLHDAALKAM
jgi:3'(2'), 5'-bisphosphate nucleotidase